MRMDVNLFCRDVDAQFAFYQALLVPARARSKPLSDLPRAAWRDVPARFHAQRHMVCWRWATESPMARAARAVYATFC